MTTPRSVCRKSVLTELSPEAVGRLARQAAEQEVSATPKPGLVCPDHQGAHTDMDHATFMASAAALEPFFANCARLGCEQAALCTEKLPGVLFPLLRKAGQQAERDMFAVTGGVNTHKGLIFSLGLICAAVGRLHLAPPGAAPHDAPPVAVASPASTTRTLQIAQAIAVEAAALVPDVIHNELEPLRTRLTDGPVHQTGCHHTRRPLTAGERLYLDHGVSGARGEASRGFPSALFALERLLHHADLPPELAVPHTLLELMAVTADTNVLARGSIEGLRFIQTRAHAALLAGGMRTTCGRAAVLTLRDDCVRHHLSPGGCADLLTLALFLQAF